MIIISQDSRLLIDSVNVEEFYIKDEEFGDFRIYARLKSNQNNAIELGSYNEAEHAQHSLYFIANCMVDKEAKEKITRLPAIDDFKPSIRSSGQGLLETIKKNS